MDETIINISIHIFVWTYIFISLGVELLGGHMIICYNIYMYIIYICVNILRNCQFVFFGSLSLASLLETNSHNSYLSENIFIPPLFFSLCYSRVELYSVFASVSPQRVLFLVLLTFIISDEKLSFIFPAYIIHFLFKVRCNER